MDRPVSVDGKADVNCVDNLIDTHGCATGGSSMIDHGIDLVRCSHPDMKIDPNKTGILNQWPCPGKYKWGHPCPDHSCCRYQEALER